MYYPVLVRPPEFVVIDWRNFHWVHKYSINSPLFPRSSAPCIQLTNSWDMKALNMIEKVIHIFLFAARGTIVGRRERICGIPPPIADFLASIPIALLRLLLITIRVLCSALLWSVCFVMCLYINCLFPVFDFIPFNFASSSSPPPPTTPCLQLY